VPGASVDWVVTVPVTIAPLCIIVKVTTVVPVPVPEEPVFGFLSTPVPSNVGGGPDAPLLVEFGAGIPPPQDASAASAATVMIFGTGFMTPPRSPSRLL
jgi:hypothetical protein